MHFRAASEESRIVFRCLIKCRDVKVVALYRYSVRSNNECRVFRRIYEASVNDTKNYSIPARLVFKC